MDVRCPRCAANLILPPDVVGQTVCCPSCRGVLLAERGRLVAPDLPMPPVASPPSRPTGADEELDDDLDLSLSAGQVFAGPGGATALARLSQTALWVRLVAAADVGVVMIIAFLTILGQRHPPMGGRHNPEGMDALIRTSLGAEFCSLLVFAPLCAMLFAAGSRLAAVKLQGMAQLGLGAGLMVSLLLGGWALLALAGSTHGRHPAPGLLTAVLAGVAALATLSTSIRASGARKAAIAAGVAKRLADGAGVPKDTASRQR
jgi:hypothetical protein